MHWPSQNLLLVHALITSRVDYCISLLHGASAHVILHLQAVMNAAVHLICGLRCFDHKTLSMRDELHRFPVRQHVDYKVALLVDECSHRAGPAYFTDYCTALTADHHRQRLVTRSDLVKPRTRAM
jgi:hypothetical protein